MSARAAFLDRSVGEVRGVITLNDRPERLIIERDSDPVSQRLGARSIARVIAIERGLGTVFLRMPDGPDAVAPLGPNGGLSEGASVSVEVISEARAEKGCVVRIFDSAVGPPRLIEEALSIEDQLLAWAPGELTLGAEARNAADEAQDAALQTVHALAGGGSIAIEPTRALTAIDVDVGARGGGDVQRSLRQTNLAAIETGARLLRLKGLGGLVVFDLAGQGHNGALLTSTAKTAFAADGAGVSIGPISRFGLFELALPWRTTPARERLLDDSGALSPLSAALALLRAIEREGRANPGSRLAAACAPDVGEAAKPYLTDLAGRIGARFTIEARQSAGRSLCDVRVL